MISEIFYGIKETFFCCENCNCIYYNYEAVYDIDLYINDMFEYFNNVSKYSFALYECLDFYKRVQNEVEENNIICKKRKKIKKL